MKKEKNLKIELSHLEDRTALSFPAKTLANILKRYIKAEFIQSGRTKNMGAWNTVRITDRTLEIINFGDKSVKYVGRKAASSTATGNFNKHLANKRNIRKDT